MQFNPSAVPLLYQSDGSGPGPSGGPTPQLWFLLTEPAPDPTKPISVDDSWNLYPKGAYLFLDEALAPGSLQDFADAASRYIADPSLVGVRFAWFTNPNDAAGGLDGTSISLASGLGGDGLYTSRAVSFAWRSLALNIDAGCPVTYVPTGPTSPGIQIGQADASNTSITVSAGGGATVIEGVNGPAMIALSGPLAGCLAFPFALGETGGVPDLASLDVGLRYYFPLPFASTAGDPGFFLQSQRYPVFDESQAVVQLYGALDPLSVDPGRTFFAFNASDAGLRAGTTAQVASNYLSVLGLAYTMAPLPAEQAPTAFARLSLSVNPSSVPPGPGDPYTLVPHGDFAITPPTVGLAPASSGVVPASAPGLRLMGGLSGVEYLALTPGAGNVLSFFPGQPAFAPQFVPNGPAGPPPVYDSSQAPTTSWAALSAGKSPPSTYCVQPDPSVLHQSGAASNGGPAINPLVYLEVPSKRVPPPSATKAFPLLPYAGVSADDLGPFQQLEAQVVAPLRRTVIAANGTPPPNPTTSGPVLGATPQGLLAQFTDGLSNWDELILAQMAGGAQLAFSAVQGNSDLLTALQSNPLFLVISDPSKLTNNLGGDTSTILIGDPAWSFLLAASSWLATTGTAGPGTILVLKYALNQSLLDLARSPTSWTSPLAFNTNPAATGAALVKILEDAVAAAETDPDFANLALVVQDLGWNGVLAFNVDTPLTSLPEQLQGIGAGIDPAGFFAHHVGVNASAISTANGTLALQTSSLFGLINYQAQGPLADDGSPYQFRVKLLKVLFLNSAVAAFSSQIELRLNQLFGDPTVPPAEDDGAVQLYGVLQKQTLPDGTVVDSFVFATAPNTTITLPMKSQVLNAVTLTKAQFVTVTPAGGGSTVVQTRFLFWGTLDFVALTNAADPPLTVDLFSFGTDPKTGTPGGLSFLNVTLDMTFDESNPGAAPTFVFDASNLSFDLAGSVARPDSLFEHFPLTLSAFVQGKSGTTPTGLGYMGVQSPLNQSALQYPWYALDFDLNLGTIGALAGEAGFVASLAVAWSPGGGGGGGTPQVFLGLQLPGSNGGQNRISIEGVLNVNFKTIALIVNPGTTSSTYILILYDITLGILSLSFPTSGQFNFVLFGDPDAGANSSSLGWYAAYAKPGTTPTKGPTAIAGGA